MKRGALAGIGGRRAIRHAMLCGLALSIGGCISGRILEGYPGYPFLSFTAPTSPDSSFFSLQRALEAEGFEIDFTDRASGSITTRPLTLATGDTFLTVVLDAAASGSRVWVAGYRPVRGGARRLDPLDEEAWAEIEEVAAGLSERLGGTPPEPPPAPPTPPD